METSRSAQRDRVFRFGPFELSECDAELRKGGVRIRLQDQPFRVLVELVANAGKVVSREELQQKLWSADTFVDFNVGLNNAIRKLRQALNDDAEHPHYIETLAKRGYRFVAQVAELGGGPQPKTESAQVAGPDQVDHSQEGIAWESGGTVSAITINKRAMPWLLVAAVFAIAALGSYLWWRGRHSVPPLATEQRVTANPSEAPITAAVISPDGKYVAYSDSTGVYIRHIDSGETRPLQLPKDFNAVPTSWFPDGTHLLLSAAEALPDFVGYGPGVIGSLWKASLLGGSPQKLIDDGYGGTVSPDGSKIAFLRGDLGDSREIWVMGSDGSNPARVVGAAVPEESVKADNATNNQPSTRVFLSSIAWSSDGTRLAYVQSFETARSGPLDYKHSLVTVDLNGRMLKVVKVSRQLLPVTCWTTDDRLLYGYRDDPDNDRFDYGIWSVRVSQKSGEPVGKEVQVTRGAGRLGGLSVSADGNRLVLLRDSLAPTVFLTTLDPATGRFTRPTRLTLDQNPNVVTAWTADSHAVVFGSSRSGTFKLFRQAIDQAVPEVLVEGRNIFEPRLSPDGRQILYLAGYYLPGYDPEAPAKPINVMAVPVMGGPPRVVLQAPFVGDIQCTRSPANICLLVNTERVKTERAIAFDPDTGEVSRFPAFQGPAAENWSLSPDGSLLALVYRGSKHKITIVTVRDNSRREVELREAIAGGVDWSADGKSIFVIARAANGLPLVLDVEPSGSYRVMLEGDRATQYWWVIPSPDGRYWALQEFSGEGNVWMVENY